MCRTGPNQTMPAPPGRAPPPGAPFGPPADAPKQARNCRQTSVKDRPTRPTAPPSSPDPDRLAADPMGAPVARRRTDPAVTDPDPLGPTAPPANVNYHL